MPTITPRPIGLWSRILLFFFIWFVCNAITALVVVLPLYPDIIDRTNALLNENSQDPIFLFVAQVASVLASVLAFWYMKRKIEESPVTESLHFNIYQFSFGAIFAIIIVTICFIFLVVTQLIEVQYNGFASVPLSMAFLILVAVSEEIVFREYIFNTLLKKKTPATAIIVSSLIFSLVHISNNHFGIIGFINIFLSGILLALVYLKFNNLSAPIGMHFTWNLTQSIFGFAVSGQQVGGVFAIHYQQNNELLTGGPFGLEGSLLLIPAVGIGVFYLIKGMDISILNSLSHDR